jgi:hypothetical protein
METDTRNGSTSCVTCQIGSEISSDVVGIAQNSMTQEPTEGQARAEVRVVNLPEMPGTRLIDEIEYSIPDLAPLEKVGLSNSITRNKGCSAPVDVWRNPNDEMLYLVDGFARIRICQEHNLPMPRGVVIEALSDQAAAIRYRIEQHLNRRNLGLRWTAYLWGAKYNYSKQVPHRPRVTDETDHNTQEPQIETDTSIRLAEEAGVGHATIDRYAKFASAIDALKAAISSEFVRGLLDRKFELSKNDIIRLANNESEANRKAIAEALISNPELTLSEAEQIVHPSATITSPTTEGDNNSEDDQEPEDNQDRETEAVEESQRTENSSDPDQVLETFNNRLIGYWATLQSISRVSRPERLRNVIRTLEDLTQRLREIEANSSS